MQRIPLENIPNQEINIVLDDNNYILRFHSCEDNKTPGDGIMSVDIIRNNEVIILGFRCTPGSLLIPYTYLEAGNFLIVTQNNEYPAWRLFGINQFLIYASQEELDGIRSNG